MADITKVKAEVAVDAVFDAMRLSMQRGERIELRGFGVFQVKPRKRGIGRNPGPARKCASRPAAPSASSPARTSRTSEADCRVRPNGFRGIPETRSRSNRSTPPSRCRSRPASSSTAGGSHILLLLLTIGTTTLSAR